ncbi:MAG: hypothetical protein KME22_17820 [Hassallia sp. WJT32-NPBG1]|jgi:hypothetical protein|nr:hypothetical protein [Hassallia sp. WJT32-NPBG1]
MKLRQFDPPANIDDFDSIPNQREAWNEFISNTFDENIKGVMSAVEPGKSQFYNPTQIETTEPNTEADITWIGFPALISRKHPGNDRAAWQEADKLLPNGERPQDEYLEWHVTRSKGKIVRVSFTCEGPEYWEALAHGYPMGYEGSKTAGATGDKQKLLALYRKYISPKVQLSDLFDQNGQYNRLNKWNTKNGAMHLNQRNNTLGAEINIAAFATILRQKDGRVLTDADELINCARYGAPGRASDPIIGAIVNGLARDGYSITLANPVGLYIDSIDTTGWTKPDGVTPVDASYWRILRGTAGKILRAVYEVPPAEGFTVGDIQIGGEQIEFGGQIAEHITMKLTGVAFGKGQIQNQPLGCEGSTLQFFATTPSTQLTTRLPVPDTTENLNEPTLSSTF